MIKLYSWKWVPPMVRGYVRDIRVRWACEEAGVPYENETIDWQFAHSDAYRAIQPFSQVPAIEEDGLKLSESGGILHHLALKSEKLMPRDADGQARVTSWMFAALNSVETYSAQYGECLFWAKGQPWTKEREPRLAEIVESRFKSLTRELGEREWLDKEFSVADILMWSVLNELNDCDLIKKYPELLAYRERGAARPAHKKAMADHMASFVDAANPQDKPPVPFTPT